MVYHWSLSDSKSSQVSRTLPSILAVLNNVVVLIVYTRPPTSKSSSPFSNLLVTVRNEPITFGIIVTCMFHSFFNFLARSRYLSFFTHSFSLLLLLYCLRVFLASYNVIFTKTHVTENPLRSLELFYVLKLFYKMI